MIETGVSYFANAWLHPFARDLEDIRAHNCSYIVTCFSENEMIFSRQRIAHFFKSTRDVGLGCWANPWAVMGLFGGEQFSAFVPRNPEACQVLSTGQRAPAACPSAPETRAAMKLWIDMATDFGADTLFWDEPHLYIPAWDDLHFAPVVAFACFCPRCRHSFPARFGQPMPDTQMPEMRLFRADLMVDFLNEMIGYAHGKAAKNAITLLPVDDQAYESLPWKRIASFCGLDIFGTDPYWFLHEKKLCRVCFCADEAHHGNLPTFRADPALLGTGFWSSFREGSRIGDRFSPRRCSRGKIHFGVGHAW